MNSVSYFFWDTRPVVEWQNARVRCLRQWVCHQSDSRFSRILKIFFLHFHFSFLISSHFFHFSKKSEGILFFTFHFSKKVKAIHISLFFLEKKEWNQVRAITSPLSLFPIVFPKIVKSQVSTSLKILAKFQFQNLDQTLCSKSEPNISLKKWQKLDLSSTVLISGRQRKVWRLNIYWLIHYGTGSVEGGTWWYWVNTGRYWSVLGCTGSVELKIWEHFNKHMEQPFYEPSRA